MKKLGLLLAVLLIAVLYCVSASALEPIGQLGNNIYWTYDKNTGELVISGEGEIPDYNSTWQNSEVKSITIENGITRIGYDAFSNCKTLIKVVIPSSVRYIAHGAFLGCISLEDLTVPASFFAQNQMMIFDDSPIKKLKVIGNGSATFGQRNIPTKHLQEVIIENGICTIGRSAFSGCNKLISISLSNSIARIEDGAFSGCYNLQEISIPNSVYYIGDYAFNGCSKLKSIVLPDSISAIYEYTFQNCSNLENILVPDNVSYIGANAFRSCAFTDFKLPEKVTSINSGTFSGCKNLTNIALDNINYIGDNAFRGTGLTDISTSDKCTYIGKAAFAECKNLKSITIKNDNVEIGDNAFYQNYGQPTIYASCGSSGYNYTKVPFSKVLFISTKHQIDEEYYYDEVTCTQDGIKYKKCKFCNEKSDIEIINPSLGHNYTDEILKQATCYYAGQKMRICSCGIMYSEIIEATGHTFDGSICINCDYDKADTCSCRCHNNSFFAKLFWNITNFFNKLFKKNDICTCDAPHY